MKNVYRICFLCVLCIISFVAGFSFKIAKLAKMNQYLIQLSSSNQFKDDSDYNITGNSGFDQTDKKSGNSSLNHHFDEASINLYPDSGQLSDENEIGFETSLEGFCVNADTDYYIYEYNKTTNKGVMIRTKLPESLDGATREEVENYFEDYNLNPSLTDRKKGFVNAFLISFSPDKMIVEKIFENELPADTYYLKAEENYIVIYCSDMITVYQYTDIKYDQLPLETRKKIDSTMKLDSYKELISFLESYTS